MTVRPCLTVALNMEIVNCFPDIANRWQSQEANNPGLPKNVVQNLRKVMNKEGRLSFERFCAGLKISILRHEAERNRVDKRHKVRDAVMTKLQENVLSSIKAEIPEPFTRGLSRLSVEVVDGGCTSSSIPFQIENVSGSATSTEDPSSSSSNDEDLDPWSAASAINRAASLPNLSAGNGTSSALSLERYSIRLQTFPTRASPHLRSWLGGRTQTSCVNLASGYWFGLN